MHYIRYSGGPENGSWGAEEEKGEKEVGGRGETEFWTG